MSKQTFIDELVTMGYEVAVHDSSCISMDYEIPVGSHAGEKIKIGFCVQEDYPALPPATGPHVSPHIVPISEGANPVVSGAHQNQYPQAFIGEWQYLSRPYPEWNNSARNAKTYMAFVRRVFQDLP